MKRKKGVVLPSDFVKVHKYMNSTGGNNVDGRISKHFFPDKPEKQKNAGIENNATGWNKVSNPRAALLKSAADNFSFDTTEADGTVHTNFASAKRYGIASCNTVSLAFSFSVEKIAREWPKLVVIIRFYDHNNVERLDKETVPVTRSPGKTSQHRIEFDVKDTERAMSVTFHIPKSSGIKAAISDITITPGPQTRRAETDADESDEVANPTPPRKFAHPGTENLAQIVPMKIDMIAGCETSYISAYLKMLGFEVNHSFENHRSMEPYSELIDEDSPYHASTADITILSQVQVLRPMITKFECAAGTVLRSEMQDWIDATLSALRWSIQQLRAKHTSKIWILSHPGYHTPAMGIHDYLSGKNGWSVFEMLSYYKLGLYQMAREFHDVYVLDVDIALERLGKIPSQGSSRIRLYESLGGHLENEGAKIVAEQLIYQVFATSQKIKRIKCVVVDCDNTLWKGVLREDGPDKVVVNRICFQRLWHIALRGIPIALCSKNDPEDLPLINKIINRYGRLHESIVTTRINWMPKSENIQSIADELNINVDTVAFFDDSAFERDEVKTNLPHVAVFSEKDIPLAAELPRFMPQGAITKDSTQRVKRYKENAARQQTQKQFGKEKFEDFLMQCQMRIEVKAAEHSDLDRVTEILQRTNQMNATLKRADHAMVKTFYDQHARSVHIIRLGDKFGDYGIIGTSLVQINNDTLFIEELALSCRAMGRRVEDALLEELVGYANDNHLKTLQISVQHTSRNAQIFQALERVGFQHLGDKKKTKEKTLTLDLSCTNKKGREFAQWFAYDNAITSDIE